MATTDDVKLVVGEALGIGDRIAHFDAKTRLLGDIPEFDSMAVVAVITGLEEHFGFDVDDDEIDADVFETVGTVCEFVERKLAS